METIRSVNPNANGTAAPANSPVPARVPSLPPAERLVPANSAANVQTAPRPPGRALAAWNDQMQDGVARAQQALDYLNSLESQLESIKSDLAARLSGARGGRALEARVRQLGSTLESRRKASGGGVDGKLNFNPNRPASQSFRIRGLDIGALKAAGTRSLAFTVAGGPQINVSIDPDMSAQDIAQRFDRAFAPLGINAGLDDGGQLVFASQESSWNDVKDSIVLVGAGRVTTEAVGGGLEPKSWDTGNVDALRQSLREVVQALARVRRSQESARAALSAAIEQASSASKPAPDEAQSIAQDFASTAANTDYDSLVAITSALVGVSRERVLALLGLR